MPIGTDDMMLDGQARASGLTLVTNNVQEFEQVHGYLVKNAREGLRLL